MEGNGDYPSEVREMGRKWVGAWCLRTCRACATAQEPMVGCPGPCRCMQPVCILPTLGRSCVRSIWLGKHWFLFLWVWIWWKSPRLVTLPSQRALHSAVILHAI